MKQKTLPHFDYRKALEEQKKKRRGKILLFLFLLLYFSFMGYLFYVEFSKTDTDTDTNIYLLSSDNQFSDSLSDIRQAILNEINKHRKKPLIFDEYLNNNAQSWAKHVAYHKVEHSGYENGTYAECIAIKSNDMVNNKPSIDLGLELVNALFESKPHYSILVDEKCRYVGIGIACSEIRCVLVVQLDTHPYAKG